jgi:hypothetical protein
VNRGGGRRTGAALINEREYTKHRTVLGAASNHGSERRHRIGVERVEQRERKEARLANRTIESIQLAHTNQAVW